MTLPTSLKDLKSSLARTKDFAREAADAVHTYIKMGKDGIWTHGTDELEVEEDALWAVNPLSFATGWSAFDTNGARVGEEMRNMAEPPLRQSDLPVVNGRWSAQIGCNVKCLNGEDEDLEGLIYQRSQGGLKELTSLLEKVLERVQNDNPECVAVISLRNDSYKHSKYGKIYTPVFELVKWVTMEGGELPAEEAPAVEAVQEEAPRSTRRRSRRRTA